MLSARDNLRPPLANDTSQGKNVKSSGAIDKGCSPFALALFLLFFEILCVWRFFYLIFFAGKVLLMVLFFIEGI